MRVDGKVLVVDDQEGIRKLLGETCNLLGYDVITAPSGKEALQLAAEHKIQAAIVDMKMPGLNGIETLRELYTLNPELKIGLMTGYGDVGIVEEIVHTLACKIIHKPFDLEVIREFLEESFSA